jgi:2-succinyl-6-hydroxy-2,4-cyclohexadiene-1-carboxylate synthase
MDASVLHFEGTALSHGDPLCFLHGFMGSGSDWAHVRSGLGDTTGHLAADLPGHGASVDRPDHDYSVEGAAQALADTLDHAGIDRCRLVGYSMGGRVALHFALTQPDRVERLVLESTSPGISDDDTRARRRRRDARRAEQIRSDLAAFLEDWYRQPLFASLERHDLVEEMVARRRENVPGELAKAVRGLSPGRQVPLWDRLGALRRPTLLLTGALDDKYRRITAEMQAALPDARRVVVPDAGHNVHAERPQAFLSHLGRFVQSS